MASTVKHRSKSRSHLVVQGQAETAPTLPVPNKAQSKKNHGHRYSNSSGHEVEWNKIIAEAQSIETNSKSIPMPVASLGSSDQPKSSKLAKNQRLELDLASISKQTKPAKQKGPLSSLYSKVAENIGSMQTPDELEDSNESDSSLVIHGDEQVLDHEELDRAIDSTTLPNQEKKSSMSGELTRSSMDEPSESAFNLLKNQSEKPYITSDTEQAASSAQIQKLPRPYRQAIGKPWSVNVQGENVEAFVTSSIEDMYLGQGHLASQKFILHVTKNLPPPILQRLPDTKDFASLSPPPAPPLPDNILSPNTETTTPNQQYSIVAQTQPSGEKLDPKNGETEEEEVKKSYVPSGVLSSIAEKIRRFTPPLSELASPGIHSVESATKITATLLKRKPQHRPKKYLERSQSTSTVTQETSTEISTQTVLSDVQGTPNESNLSNLKRFPTLNNKSALKRGSGRSNIAADVIRGPFFSKLRFCSSSAQRCADNMQYIHDTTEEDLDKYCADLDRLTESYDALEVKTKKLARQFDDTKHAARSTQTLLYDSIYKTTNTLYHIKSAKKTKTPMRVLLVILSLLILIVGTGIWITAAAYRAFLRSLFFVKTFSPKKQNVDPYIDKASQHPKPPGSIPPSKPSLERQNQTEPSHAPTNNNSNSNNSNSNSVEIKNENFPITVQHPAPETSTPPDTKPQITVASPVADKSFSPTKPPVSNPSSPSRTPVQLQPQQLQAVAEMSKSIKEMRAQEAKKKKQARSESATPEKSST